MATANLNDGLAAGAKGDSAYEPDFDCMTIRW